ncbi:hypothetical protein ABIC83_003053 [Roseateles asaccharophilus]|uniref:hypothetical protein n=1 Tax=Roseateles asaccharophilus TaxID=582607 RepID=UPI003833C1CD
MNGPTESSEFQRDPVSDATARLCSEDNWDQVLDDPAPRAVRWATRTLVRQFNDPDFGKWHYTEGNGNFTACDQPVVLSLIDGSPEESDLGAVTCKRCLSKMRRLQLPMESRSA